MLRTIKRNRIIPAALVVLCGTASTSLAQWTGPFDADQRIQYTAGRVLVGPNAPGNSKIRFDVVEPGTGTRDIALHAFAGTPNSGIRTTAIWGETNNPAGRALQGFNFASTGQGAGIWAETASETGYGLRARSTSFTGANYAAYFDARSPNGYAIYAESNASTGGYGIYGVATALTGSSVGIWGAVASPSGIGLYGYATASTGSPIGVWGRCGSLGGFAGYFTGAPSYFSNPVGIGTTSAAEMLHVEGNIRVADTSVIGGRQADAVNGGLTIQGPGTAGSSGVGANGSTLRLAAGNGNSSAPSQPPIGTSLDNNLVLAAGENTFGGLYGDYFNGNIIFLAGDGLPERMRLIGDNGYLGIGNNAPSSPLTVTGNISGTTIDSGLKNFKIDHPLDPENAYLYHASIESNEAINVYSGTVKTDYAGYATITMPAWFDALNENIRYQLTVIEDKDEDTFVLAKVARKMSNNQFTIRTSQGEVEVSWQITGTRKDAFIKAHPMHVEVAKTQAERGKYLYPEAYGLPASRGVNTAAPQTQRDAWMPGANATAARTTSPAALPAPARIAPPLPPAQKNEPPLTPAIRADR
jgi:hypothetical protein